jgi:hypothetical protein
MTPVIILAAIILAPIVLLLLLRVNAALAFLSLCLGDVLVQFVAGNANSFFALLSTSQATHASQLSHVSSQLTQPVHATNDTIRLLLLLIPPALTAICMIRTIHGRGRLLLNALPAAGTGLLGALLVVPLLPATLSHNIVDSSLWSQVQRSQAVIVGTSALVCLLVLWLQRPKAGGGKHGHAKHHKG